MNDYNALHCSCRAYNAPSAHSLLLSSFTYQELNVKTKNYEDLISGVKFNKKKDVIILNDPQDEEHNRLRDINNFHHIRHAREMKQTSTDNSVQHSVTATRIMEKLKQQKKNTTTSETSGTNEPPNKKLKIFSDAVTGVQMTSGKVSGSLTSTVMNITNDDDDAKEATQEEILQAQFQVMRKGKKKGYVTLHTNLGDIGLELHCDIAPRTCTNFLGLAEAGKYNNTKFHRLIPGFMIQGGKSKTGEDASLWGEAFVNECDDRLTHTGEGILAMANAGADTNKQQFYLTFASCNHLDRKHSVFGRVVQGIDVLKAMEKIPTDKKDRPVEEITITSVEVLSNPAREAEEAERIRIEERSKERKLKIEAKKSSALGLGTQASAKRVVPSGDSGPQSTGPAPIGKYLSKAATARSGSKKADPKDDDASASKSASSAPASRLPPPPKKTKFNDFSGW